MEIIQVVGLALIATVLILVIREQKPMFAFLIAAATGIVIFMLLIGKIWSSHRSVEAACRKFRHGKYYLKTVLKIIGIAYIAEFGAQIVRDAGQESIASRSNWPVRY